MGEQRPEPRPVTKYLPDPAGEVKGLPPLDWSLILRTGELVATPTWEPEQAVDSSVSWCVEREGRQHECKTQSSCCTVLSTAAWFATRLPLFA